MSRNKKSASELDLGPDVIQQLLPHRRPFLMVDRVLTYAHGPQPELTACRYISANEEVFAGHFPGLKIWPGAYTIEGLGQSGNLLRVLQVLMEQVQEAGGSLEDAYQLLRNIELGFRMHPGYRPEVAGLVLDKLPDPRGLMGFAAGVQVKLLAPVMAGQRLDYHVRQTHVVDKMVRWQVEALVQGTPVARGELTSRVGLFRGPATGAR
jgi:3-hydroxyacyl-[acyl-carrier-protein] dehydratase